MVSIAALLSSACEAKRSDPPRPAREEAPSETAELPPVGAPPLPVAEPRLVLQSASAIASHGARPPSNDAGPARYAFDFEDAGLPELVRLVSVITGKRFLVSGQLPAVKATSRSPEPVTADEAYEAFLAILHANGLTLVRRGRVEVVVTEASLLGR